MARRRRYGGACLVVACGVLAACGTSARSARAKGSSPARVPPPVPAASDAASGVTRLAHPGPIAGRRPRATVADAPDRGRPDGCAGDVDASGGGRLGRRGGIHLGGGAVAGGRSGRGGLDRSGTRCRAALRGHDPTRWELSVPGHGAPSLVTNLVAAFEGGFQFAVSNGGFEQDGVVGAPLVEGAASLVELTNGRVEIGAWGSEVGPSPAVSAVRQNLTLLVDHGAVLPTASENPLVTWGYSLGNLLATWRSGLGITSHGNLVWVGGPGLSPATLGSMLVWAGAVRGMQLDINPYWVSFATFAEGPNGLVATNLLPSMAQAPTHYLVPFWRDFVAVFLAEPGSP